MAAVLLLCIFPEYGDFIFPLMFQVLCPALSLGIPPEGQLIRIFPALNETCLRQGSNLDHHASPILIGNTLPYKLGPSLATTAISSATVRAGRCSGRYCLTPSRLVLIANL